MRETGGNGVGRLFEATGAAPMINNCFALLRQDTGFAMNYTATLCF